MRPFLSLVFITLILSACADKCEDVTCEQGVCVDGDCECNEGYSGKFCRTVVDPQEIIIQKVEFDDIPDDWFGVKWDKDDGSNPDVYMIIEDASDPSNRYFRSRELYVDAAEELLVFDDSLQLSLKDEQRFEKVSFKLYDKDEEGNLGDLILTISEPPYITGGQKPEVLEIEWNFDMTIRIHMSYSYED